MGLSGPLEIYGKAPNKGATIINISGFGVVQFGFNGTIAWSQDPQTGFLAERLDAVAQGAVLVGRDRRRFEQADELFGHAGWCGVARRVREQRARMHGRP